MTQREWEQWERTVASLSDSDRAELSRRLQRTPSLEHPVARSGNGQSAAIARQKQAWVSLLGELPDLPIVEEPRDGLIGSVEHDKILYDRSGKAGTSKKPPR